MKYVTIWLIAASLFIHSSSALAEENAGLIKNVSGDVLIQRGDTALPAVNGADLQAEDILITGKNSYAGIIFTDGTRFTMGPGTKFTLNQYKFKPENKAYDFSMYLERGSGLYHSGKIGKLAPEVVSLSTPQATVGIRGTRFLIKVDN